MQVFELMRKQEETRLTELEAEKVKYAISERLRDMVSSVPLLDANDVNVAARTSVASGDWLLTRPEPLNYCILSCFPKRLTSFLALLCGNQLHKIGIIVIIGISKAY